MFCLGVNWVYAQPLKFFASDRYILGIYKERTASLDVGDLDGDGEWSSLAGPKQGVHQ